MAPPDPPNPRSLYAVAAIREFGGSEVFCITRRLEDGEHAGAPFVLAIDDATEASLEHQVGLHVLSPNHKSDGVALVGVIVGAGHPAMLSAVEKDGSLRALREVDTTILSVEVAGPDARPPQGEVAYDGILLYRPAQPTAVRQRPWWRFWGRG